MNAVPATDVRAHILEVAYPILLRKGFTAVGLTEVLAAAQVPKGSFYHYFGSKEAFGEALLESYFNDHLARMDALLDPPGSSADRLMRYFSDWLNTHTDSDAQSRCLVVKLAAEVSDLSETMRAALRRGTHRIVQRLQGVLEAGRADRSLPGCDPQTLAMELYQNWLGASLLGKITRDRAPLEAALRATRQTLGLIPLA